MVKRSMGSMPVTLLEAIGCGALVFFMLQTEMSNDATGLHTSDRPRELFSTGIMCLGGNANARHNLFKELPCYNTETPFANGEIGLCC